MPWSVSRDASACPSSKPHAVKGPDGKVVPGGCHATREQALKHQRAISANSDETAAALRGDDPLREIVRRLM